MKKMIAKLKPMAVVAGWILLFALMVSLLGASLQKRSNMNVGDIDVFVDPDQGLFFVQPADILQQLHDLQVQSKGESTVGEISFTRLEENLLTNEFIASASVSMSARGKLQVLVTQRVPLLRIINSRGVGYYLDESGRRMPCSNNFTARVPVATGWIQTHADQPSKTDSLIERKLFLLASHIHRDSFLNALIAQIVVNPDQEFELIPVVGSFSILLGDEKKLDEKFSRLKTFYKATVLRVDWNQYTKINIQYSGKVYCVKKDKAVLYSTGTDVSTQATH